MTARTDLTWAELHNASGGYLILEASIGSNNPPELMLRINHLLELASPLTSANYDREGVIKAVVRLLEICLTAQETFNADKQPAQKLNSFKLAGSGSPKDGKVPINYTCTAQYGLNTTPEITGSLGSY